MVNSTTLMELEDTSRHSMGDLLSEHQERNIVHGTYKGCMILHICGGNSRILNYSYVK